MTTMKNDGREDTSERFSRLRNNENSKMDPKCLLSGLCRCDGCAAGKLKALARPTSVYATIRYSQKLMECRGMESCRAGQAPRT